MLKTSGVKRGLARLPPSPQPAHEQLASVALPPIAETGRSAELHRALPWRRLARMYVDGPDDH